MRTTLALTLTTALVLGTLAGCTTIHDQTAPVTLGFRPGSWSPGTGLTKMTPSGSETPVYLSEDVVLSNADVESARVISGSSGPQIEIVFTRAGTERFAAVTAANIRKPLGILIDGQLISAPTVMESITGGKAWISGSFSQEEAKRIADGVAGR